MTLQHPSRLDEAVVGLAACGINGPDDAPAEGVAIVELQRDVRVYFPGDLAVRQGGEIAVSETGPAAVAKSAVVVCSAAGVPKVFIGIEP